MSTNKDRLNFLKDRLDILTKEIITEKREQEYLDMMKGIADKQVIFQVLAHDEWELMLPIERKEHLLRYYHTVRSELRELASEVNKISTPDKLTQWLESKWVLRGIAAATIVNVAIQVLNLAQQTGFFYDEIGTQDSVI